MEMGRRILYGVALSRLARLPTYSAILCKTQHLAPVAVQPGMMDGSMGPMMGWMMGFGGPAALVVLTLVVAGVVVWLVRGGASGAKIALGVLAVVGALALVAATAMAVMHFGMGGCA
jgi:hypothetical protein